MRDRIVADVGLPARILAAADVNADGQAVGRAGDHRVDDRDVGVQEIAPVVAALLEELAHARVAELDQRGLVDLQVAAVRLGQRAHLLMVGGDEVRPERIEVRIDLAADIGAPGAVMDVAGAGQRDLRRAARHRLEEGEIAGVLRTFPGDAVDHLGDAARGAVAVRLRLGPAGLFSQFDRDAGNARRGKRIRIGSAPEVAVGHDGKPDVLLQLHDAADRFVLDRSQRLAREPAQGMLGARAQQRGRPQQAADMLGAKRRRAAHGSGVSRRIDAP